MKLTEAQKKELMKHPKVKKLHAHWKKIKGQGKMMRGGDFFGDVGNWFKKAGEDVGKWVQTAATDTDRWLRKNKPLSKVFSGITAVAPFVGAPEVSLVTGPAAKLMDSIGYGKTKGGRSLSDIDWKSFGDMLKGAYPILAPVFMGSGCCGGLSINPQGQRLGQSGSGRKMGGMVNAMPRDALGTAGMMARGRRKGKGVGAFNTISSSFGQIQV